MYVDMKQLYFPTSINQYAKVKLALKKHVKQWGNLSNDNDNYLNNQQ